MKTKVLLLILTLVTLRLLPHVPNVVPVSAITLFSSAYLSKKYVFIIPLFAMFISDIFLGFHSTMIWVYLSFALIAWFGFCLRANVSVLTVFKASLGASLLFYLLSNFGVWIQGEMYPQTWVGLMDCYYMALPFFRNTLLGDFFYSAVFFGGYQLFLHNFKICAILPVLLIHRSFSR